MRAHLLAAGFSLLGSAVWAQGPIDLDEGITLEQMRERAVQSAERRFEALDTDGDGVLSREELQAARDRRPRGIGPRLGDADTDGDGSLNYSELQAVRPELTVEQFNRMDSNGDGLITEDERPRFRRRPGPREL